jgi:hypothetical protein
MVWVDPTNGDLRVVLSKSDAFDENSKPVKTGVLRFAFDPPLWKGSPLPPPPPVPSPSPPPIPPGERCVGVPGSVLAEDYVKSLASNVSTIGDQNAMIVSYVRVWLV